jgi:type IV pilus biogenesis protein CpaD/CtpE
MNVPRADRRVVVLMLLALLVGCASKHEVKCDARLEPINTPSPKASVSSNQDALKGMPSQTAGSQP